MSVLWFPMALADVEQLRAYIALDNPVAAEDTLIRIPASVQSLLTFPGRGRVGRVAGTRELVVPRTPYLVAYRLRGGTIEIHRVLHGAQEWPRS